MNYIAEINAFEQWLETHHLPISAQLLWYKLMAICNRAGWCEWVTVDNLRLMATMQMSREATLIKTRDELIKAGLVEYQKGKKGSPNKYKISSLVTTCTFKSVVQNEVESGVKRVVKNEVKEVVESVDIYKHKQNKTSKKEIEEKEPLVIELMLNDGSLYGISKTKVEEWSSLYPVVDVMQELRNMKGWLNANTAKRKTRRGILKFVNGWLAREQDRGKRVSSSAPRQGATKFNNCPERNYTKEDYSSIEQQIIQKQNEQWRAEHGTL